MKIQEVKPSLTLLAFMLRHPELWPDGFEWNYHKCQNCAMGLAGRLWLVNPYPRPSLCLWLDAVIALFPISSNDAHDLFAEPYPASPEITPGFIADKIDRYVALQESKCQSHSEPQPTPHSSNSFALQDR